MGWGAKFGARGFACVEGQRHEFRLPGLLFVALAWLALGAGPAYAVCGDGVVDPGESCDGRSCCTDTCDFEFSGILCADSPADLCADFRMCDGAGTCVSYGPVGQGQHCGESACEFALCDGLGSCIFIANAEVGEACDHYGDTCGGVHRCDDDGACVAPGPAPAGTGCGPTDACGTHECDGVGGCELLPEPFGAPCPDDGDACNGVEACDGAGGCHAPAPAPLGTECPSDGDACNGVEACDGNGGCQAPAPAPLGTECPSDGDVCNGVEACDGAGTCVALAVAPAGTRCDDETLCTANVCDGFGSCVSAPDPGCDEFCFVEEPPPVTAPETSNGQAAMGPAFVDIDADGDLDLFFLVRDLESGGDGRIELRENIGSPTAPALGPPVQGPFGLGPLARDDESTPTFSDIDGDDDLDLFLLRPDGIISFAENVGAADAPAFAPWITNPFGLTNLEAGAIVATADFADIDDDGDDDLFVGSDDQAARFYENVGTPEAPAFAAAQANPFGLGFSSDLQHVSPKLVDLDRDGDLDAILGRSTGANFDAEFFVVENVGTPSAPAFSGAHAAFVSENSWFAHAEVVDLDGDGDLEAFVRCCMPWQAPVPRNLRYFEDRCDVCGDAETQTWEQCDDGNVADGDRCSSACLAEPAGPAFDSCVAQCDGVGGRTECTTDAWDRASLVVSEKRHGYEKLTARLLDGPTLSGLATSATPRRRVATRTPFGSATTRALWSQRSPSIGRVTSAAPETVGGRSARAGTYIRMARSRRTACTR